MDDIERILREALDAWLSIKNVSLTHEHISQEAKETHAWFSHVRTKMMVAKGLLQEVDQERAQQKDDRTYYEAVSEANNDSSQP